MWTKWQKRVRFLAMRKWLLTKWADFEEDLERHPRLVLLFEVFKDFLVIGGIYTLTKLFQLFTLAIDHLLAPAHAVPESIEPYKISSIRILVTVGEYSAIAMGLVVAITSVVSFTISTVKLTIKKHSDCAPATLPPATPTSAKES